MTSTWVDYTEAQTDVAIDDIEENSPSSFARECNERAKSRFPCLRSYMFRRRLSCVAVTSMFIVAGVLASFHMNAFDFGKLATRDNLVGSSTNSWGYDILSHYCYLIRRSTKCGCDKSQKFLG
jgi:hypothetical protein